VKRKSIYKNELGKKQVLHLYDKLLAEIPVPYERLWIDTRFGKTHVLRLGNEQGPPLVTFHGGNSLNPYDLKNLIPLVDKYSIYAPDTIGHPGYSAETRLSSDNCEYGEWALDILDNLGIDKANFIGPSFGGGILSRLATIAPERIRSAVFVVPTGFIKPSPSKMIFKLVMPMMLYIIAPSRKRLERVVQPLADQLEPDLLAITEVVFKHVKVESTMPRPAKKEELANLKAPVLLIAAERDILSPGKDVIEMGKELIPQLVEYECLEGAPHAFYTAEGQREYVISKIDNFLQKYSNS
jgi:pimeloyl-ACP methyl ester carboxylesterase